MPKQRREWKLYNEDIERTFTQHQTQITQLDDSITLQASTITSLDGKVEEYYSELVVADTGIRTEVATKVGADSIISTINQSAEAVTIDASKINLNGFVTFTNLAAYGDHTIALGDGSNTLTIDGSTITGTNASGYIGYKLRPSAIDIYSFTSANDVVGHLSATKSSEMSASDVGVALYADAGDWLTLGRYNSTTGKINAVMWSDPSTKWTHLGAEGSSYAQVSLGPTKTSLGLGGTDGFQQTTTQVTVGDDSIPTLIQGTEFYFSHNNVAYMGLASNIWNIRATSGNIGGPSSGTYTRGMRWDASDLYVFNDTTASTYIEFTGASINLSADSGKIQLYGPGGRSLYLGQNGLMYTDGNGTVKYVALTTTPNA